MKTKKLTQIALLSSLAVICGYIESLIPIIVSVPGIKLGISNVVILFALFRLDKSSAFFIMLVKVAVSSVLFTGFGVLMYSLSGGILSFLAMCVLKKLRFSAITISMLGAVFHNIGQLFAASFMLKSFSVFYYLPVLLTSGLLLGLITGAVCKVLIERVKPKKG